MSTNLKSPFKQNDQIPSISLQLPGIPFWWGAV